MPNPTATTEGTIENRYYRVVLDADSGAIKSIFDKELNKELVNTSSPYRFNQYLYVTGADQTSEPGARIQSCRARAGFHHPRRGQRAIGIRNPPALWHGRAPGKLGSKYAQDCDRGDSVRRREEDRIH